MMLSSNSEGVFMSFLKVTHRVSLTIQNGTLKD